MIKIEEYIPCGYENRVTREDLVRRTGLTDREVRRAIELSELPIINVGKGYFVATSSDIDKTCVKIYVTKEVARIKSISRKLKKFIT